MDLVVWGWFRVPQKHLRCIDVCSPALPCLYPTGYQKGNGGKNKLPLSLILVIAGLRGSSPVYCKA